MSGVAVKQAGMDVLVKCGDSRSNSSRDVRAADLVSNERTNLAEAYGRRRKLLSGISPKTVSGR